MVLSFKMNTIPMMDHSFNSYKMIKNYMLTYVTKVHMMKRKFAISLMKLKQMNLFQDLKFCSP